MNVYPKQFQTQTLITGTDHQASSQTYTAAISSFNTTETPLAMGRTSSKRRATSAAKKEGRGGCKKRESDGRKDDDKGCGGNGSDGSDRMGPDHPLWTTTDRLRPDAQERNELIYFMYASTWFVGCAWCAVCNCLQRDVISHANGRTIFGYEPEVDADGNIFNPGSSGDRGDLFVAMGRCDIIAMDKQSQTGFMVDNRVQVGEEVLNPGELIFHIYEGKIHERADFQARNHTFGIIRLEVTTFEDNNANTVHDFHYVACLLKGNYWYLLSGENGSNPLRIKDLTVGLYTQDGRNAISFEIQQNFPGSYVTFPTDQNGALQEIAFFPKIALKQPLDIWGKLPRDMQEHFISYEVVDGLEVPGRAKYAARFVNLDDAAQYIALPF